MSPKLLASLIVLATGSSNVSLVSDQIESQGFGLVSGFPPGASVNQAPYRSDAFGFEVAFPPGSIACAGIPGHFNRNYNSFVAWYDGNPATCASGQPRSGMTVLGMRADFNTAEWGWEDLLSDDCLDGSKLGIDIAQVRTLSFPGHPSLTCLTQGEDGSIEIRVVTQAGEPFSEGGPPDVNYEAFLFTDPARFETNLTRFRMFLASARMFPRLRV